MNTNISINVSYRENLLLNGSFEIWNESGNVPNYWDFDNSTNNDIAAIKSPGGYGVNLIVGDNSASSPCLKQDVVIDKTETVNLSFSYRGSVKAIWYKKSGSLWVLQQTINLQNEGWANYSCNLYGLVESDEIRLRLFADYQTDYENRPLYANFDDVILSYEDWYLEPIYTKDIINIDTLQKQIEDNIFSYRSSNIDFTLADFETKENYFNYDDFFNKNTTTYRFDINIEYTDGNFSRKITTFCSLSDIKRINDFNSKIPKKIQIESYELLAFLKNQNLYLGELTQDIDDDGDPEGEPYYLYSTAKIEDNSNTYLSISDIFDSINDEISKLTAKTLIPLSGNELQAINGLSVNESDTIKINYNSVIGGGEGEYYLIDAVYTNTKRTFFLLAPENNFANFDAGDYSVSNASIFELKNGSTLENTGFVSETGCVFLHRYLNDNWENENDKPIEFGIMSTIEAPSPGEDFIIKLDKFTNNTYNPDTQTSNNLKRYETTNAFVANSPSYDDFLDYQQRARCAYINYTGNFQIPSIYISTYDNFIWIDSGLDNQYGTLYPENKLDSYATGIFPTRIFSKLTAEISRFPQAVSYKLKDITLGGFLKEITVLYDAIFFFEYDSTLAPISINVIQRSDTGTATTLGKKTYSEQTFSSFNFGRLNSQVYAQDEQRLRVYIGYYDYKYGTGSIKYKYDLWGINDIDIGNYVEINGNQYLITYIEYLPDSYLTRIECQEIK
jgi:hypothetical protein